MSSSAIQFGSTNVTLQGAAAFKNKIINGNFDIWQRAVSHSTAGYGSDDRWNLTFVGSSATNSRQTFTLGQTDVPNNPQYFKRIVATSVAGSGNLVANQQRIEGVRTFSGQTVTLSFWAKADASKNMAVEFSQSFGTGGSPSSSITGIGVTTCSLTTSWKKFTITTTIPSISGKTLGTNNNDFIEIIFWFDAGSSFNSRTNSLGQQSGTFDIAQVQLEEGTISTPFENRPVGIELQLCQRYYQQAVGQGGTLARIYNNGASSGLVSLNVFFKQTMRSIPSSISGVYDINDGTGQNFSSAGNPNQDSFVLTVTIPSGQFLDLQSYTASAEL
ncbi:hypothetical protein EBS40_05600 [bacterium]|nr:hypothetical protein [bacterium]